MTRVLVAEKIGEPGVQLLRDAGFEVELGSGWEDGELERRIAEVYRDWWKAAYVREARRYIPELDPADMRFGPSGVRAQCVSPAGELVDDFRLDDTAAGITHVINAPSPAATACLAIGREVARIVLGSTP